MQGRPFESGQLGSRKDEQIMSQESSAKIDVTSSRPKNRWKS